MTSDCSAVALTDERGVITAKGSGTAGIVISVTYNKTTVSRELGIAVK